jgi:type IV secretion system protein VirD4
MTDAKRIKRLVLPNLPYLFLWWLFDKAGQAVRLSNGRDMLRKIIGGVANLDKAFVKPLPSFVPSDILVGLVGAAAVFGIVLYRKRHTKKWRKDIEYGSARWGNEKDIAPYVDPKPENNVILTATESLTLNGRPKNPKYARNKNILIVGGSGSGKTRFFLKPNLMQMHSSYVITDPKGTVLIETGRMLKRGGYEIKVLNTIDFKKSMHYNPFKYIRSEKDVLKFVTALIANTKGEGKSGDDFWVKAETLLYCALIGAIHYQAPPAQQNMNTLVEMINMMETREDDESFKNAIDYYFEELENGNEAENQPPQPQHFAVRQYKKYKLAAGVICSKRLIYQTA